MTLVSALVACAQDTPTASPDLVRYIIIVATPDADTLQVHDSVVLHVNPTPSPPTALHWSVWPRGDTTTADSLVFVPHGEGTEWIHVVARFPDGAVGVADRRFVTRADRANQAPTITITDERPDGSGRVPLGDTVALTAITADPDGDVLSAVQWQLETGDSSVLIATGDRVRLPVEATGVRVISARVTDAGGAYAVARFVATAYDPGVPARWGRYATGQNLVVLTEGRLVFAGGVCDSRCGTVTGVAAVDTNGAMVWSLPALGGRPTAATQSGDTYVFGFEGSLTSVSAGGMLQWTIPPDSVGAWFGPSILLDGSAVVAASTLPARVRRIAANGMVQWLVTLPDSHSNGGGTGCCFPLALAVASDSTVHVLGRLCPRDCVATVSALRPDGALLWQVRVPGPPPDPGSVNPRPVMILLGDDSTLLVGTGPPDSLHAFSITGAHRWTIAAPLAVVAGGGVAYAAGAGGIRAIRLTDGSEVWRLDHFAPHGDPVLTANGLLLVRRDAEIVGLDVATGAQRWRHEMRSDGFRDSRVREMALTADGALYAMGGGYLELIDVGAGPLPSAWAMLRADGQRSGRLGP